MASRMLQSVGMLSVISVLQLLTQFALQRILADQFGAGAEVDAFHAALALPSTLNTMISVSVGFVLIPALTTAFHSDRYSVQAWRLASASGWWLMLIAGFLSGGLAWFHQSITETLYRGFDATTQSISSDCLKILAWQLALGAMVAWLTAIYNARHSFAWPALTAFLGAILNLILAQQWMQIGIDGYVWSIMVSGTTHTLLLLLPVAIPLIRHFQFQHQELLPLLSRWIPLLLGGAYVRLDLILDRYLGAFLEEGSIAHLGYAQRFIQAILAIATGGLLTVLLPNLSAASTENLPGGLGERLRRGLQGLSLIVIPILIGGLCFAEWSTRDLLQRGAFTASDTLVVAELFRILLVFFVCASLGDLVARGFYSLHDTRTPTVIGMVSVTIAAAFKILWTQQYGVQVLAWGTALYFLLTLVLMAWLLSRRVKGMFDRRWLASIGKGCVSSLIACGVAWLIADRIGIYGTWVAAPVGALFYVGGLLLLKESLAEEMWNRYRSR